MYVSKLPPKVDKIWLKYPKNSGFSKHVLVRARTFERKLIATWFKLYAQMKVWECECAFWQCRPNSAYFRSRILSKFPKKWVFVSHRFWRNAPIVSYILLICPFFRIWVYCDSVIGHGFHDCIVVELFSFCSVYILSMHQLQLIWLCSDLCNLQSPIRNEFSFEVALKSGQRITKSAHLSSNIRSKIKIELVPRRYDDGQCDNDIMLVMNDNVLETLYIQDIF